MPVVDGNAAILDDEFAASQPSLPSTRASGPVTTTQERGACFELVNQHWKNVRPGPLPPGFPLAAEAPLGLRWLTPAAAFFSSGDEQVPGAGFQRALLSD